MDKETKKSGPALSGDIFVEGSHFPQERERLSCPLAVDLDGTWVKTDTTFEALAKCLFKAPAAFFKAPYWLLKDGKPAAKERLWQAARPNVSIFPRDENFQRWVKTQAESGRTVWLATGASESAAKDCAVDAGCFSETFSSRFSPKASVNLTGKAKADALDARVGPKAWSYCGNESVDLTLWERGKGAVFVGPKAKALEAAASADCAVEASFPSQAPWTSCLLRQIRIKQWCKNLLVFVPLLASHHATATSVGQSLLAFLAFCLCASSVYLLNDMSDLENDRRHPTKRSRPMAAGDFPIAHAMALAPALLLASVAIGAFAGAGFVALLALYFGLTCAYSWKLKRIPLANVAALAGLYTIRVWAGSAATGIAVSDWLSGFCLFAFLGLALLKRCAELRKMAEMGRHKASGRGYESRDAEILRPLGVACAPAAATVLALYLASPETLGMYAHPSLLHGATFCFLFWFARMWLAEARGEMSSDPISFALKDKASLALVGACALFFLLAL